MTSSTRLQKTARFVRGICPLLIVSFAGEACVLEEGAGTEPRNSIPREHDASLTEVAEPFDSEAYRAFLLESARQSPDPEEFEQIGYLKPSNSDVWIHDEPPAASLEELLRDRELVTTEGAAHDAAQGILVAADGRVFLERADHFRERARRIERMPAAAQSQGAGSLDGSEPAGAVEARTLDTIHGSDDRTPVTSSTYPTRAVGVALLRSTESGWARGAGSASMVGPRAALTVAHAISPDGTTWNVLGVGPAARGISYCEGGGSNDSATCKFPYGLRWVQWYYWPGSWDGTGITYDYGVLILDDQNWSPGSVSFGYQTTTWLDYREMDSAGYPAPSKTCANAIDADGQCGGYMYRQTSDTNAVYTNYAYYDFDVQEGQSGAPIYDITSSTGRVVYILHKGSEGAYSYGKRLRSGSFDTICGWIGNWPSSHFGNISC